MLSCLVERERLGGGAFEGARAALRRACAVGVAERRLALDRVGFGEVEGGFAAGAGAGDVAPFLERALVGKEDVGALDGCPLGAMPGERVAVLEMVARVSERQLAGRAVVGAEGERVVANREDGGAGAVADAEARVVLSAEDAVGDPE